VCDESLSQFPRLGLSSFGTAARPARPTAAQVCSQKTAISGNDASALSWATGLECTAASEETQSMSGNFAPLNCLKGVRVVDLTQFEAGPTCTEALAWLGAEVVKIENPKSGDPGRRIASTDAKAADSFYFKILNANKKSATVDLKTPRGVELVKELVKKADVFAENLAPGTIERLGLGYDVLKEIKPGIIYCQVKGFGEGSPYERSLAFDMIAQASGGTMSVTGEPGQAPVKPGCTIGDTGTGMLMAISVLGALYEKKATGKGRRLQLAMQDSVMHYIRTSFAVMAQKGNKEAAPRMGAQSTSGAPAPCGIYPTKPFGYNDYVYIFCSRANPEHWNRLLKVIGREELIDDPRFATNEERNKNEGFINEIITEWTKNHTKVEAMQIIGAAGVPAGAVHDTLELQNDASFDQRGIMQVMHHPDGDWKCETWPVRFDGKPPELRPSPKLGQHTDEVFSSWLGMSTGDVEGLKKEGAI
jgi:crotonobetainyl-CoA:carnitine CoA-transferase CaiB-like acyl-CoA transferase